VKLDFLDIDEVAKDLTEVTTTKIYSKHGFHPDGLFSQQIFGPVKTATCACNVYMGRSRIGDTCQTCGVDITYSSVRRRRFAKIVLPFPVLNPIMYHLVFRAGKTKMKTIMEALLYNDKIAGYYWVADQKRYVPLHNQFKEKESDEEVEVKAPEGCELFSGIDGIYKIVQRESTAHAEKDTNWRFVRDNIDKFYMNNILVPPPEFRPVSKSKDAQMRDEMNQYFVTILNFSTIMKDDHLETPMVRGIGEISSRNLQKHIFNLYDYIFTKLSKKKGLIRGAILGKRVDFSGRAVITPDPTLKVDECSIPYKLALELYKLEVANSLLEKRRFKRYDSAIDHIEKCISLNDKELLDITKEVCEGKYVVLNRQPTLHRMGILAFRCSINDTYVVKIHPMACEPYNADFDGDQMAIYRALYDETEEECKTKLSVKANLVCPTTGGMVLGVNQDVVLGLYLLTQPNDKNEYTTEDGINTYKGRVIFNQCLPENYAFINQTVDKKILRIILDDICRTLPPDEVSVILDKIKDLGFKFTTMSGCTMSLKNMRLPHAKDIVSGVLDDDSLDWYQKFDKIQSDEVTQPVKDAFPYKLFIESGSRGSWDQANQIILSRGYVSNFAGDIVRTPIKSSLIDGMSRMEFFTSCYGSRKGLLDTALNTGESGYLTRKLVYAAVNLELDETVDDCKCRDTFNIMIPDKENGGLKMAKTLVGRYVVEFGPKGEQTLHEITYGNYHNYVDRAVNLRSPLFCKSIKVCKTCYGTTEKHLHSKYIGIIAAQAMGEVSTQLVLRTFHTSGAAKVGKGGEQQEDIVNDLSVVKKVFHAGAGYSYDQSILKLYDVYSRYKGILLVHYECIIAQMMRRGKMRWRLTEDRVITEYELVSIEQVPARESWLLALAFSRPKSYLIDGIIEDGSSASGVLERIMMNERPKGA
jgi:DNA-directed RNA polymerase subunit beta'